MKRKHISGLSLAINKTMDSYLKEELLIEKSIFMGFTLKVANTLEEREAAFRLSYEVYLDKGFIKENPNKMLVQDYDANENTVVLLVQDQFKKIAGSVTIVFDGDSVLPAEKIYHEELKALRNKGQKMAELSRLVISPEYRNSKEILILLFNYATIYIRLVKQFNCLSIQVNPRHKIFYKSLLNFDEVGGLKLCPQVLNAPAVLLFITENQYQKELNHLKNLSLNIKKDRTLYQFFLKVEQESLVAYYLKKQFKPISAEEKIYFGFSGSNIGQAVAV
jgi:hypothetical protein